LGTPYGSHFLCCAHKITEKMELAVLGAGAYLASSMFANEKTPVTLTPEQERERMLESPADLFMHEFRERGAIRPRFGAQVARNPWDPAHPPYYTSQTAPGGPNVAPTERLYQVIVNASEHERHDLAQELHSNYAHYARKTAVPVWTAFSREVGVPDTDGGVRSTYSQGFQWLPPNPTDSDWNEAALLAKQLPGDPQLFTPDATYMTAPGLAFRYGANKLH